jgi:hypothetical protein
MYLDEIPALKIKNKKHDKQGQVGKEHEEPDAGEHKDDKEQ